MNNLNKNTNYEYIPTTLAELIDQDTSPIRALTTRMEIFTQEEVFNMLDTEFQKAINNETLICDEFGWHYETEFASITLVPNLDESSQFVKYLKFSFKDYKYSEWLRQVSNIDDNQQIELPESLEEVYLVSNNLLRLNRFVAGDDQYPSAELINALKKGYESALLSDSLIPYDRGYNFYTGLKTRQHEDIIAGIKLVKNEDGSDMWLMNYIGYRDSLSGNAMGYALDDFADLQGDAYLYELASLARDEEWSFSDGTYRYEILKNYVSYTFFKLQLEGKICINEDGTFAAFNTGLPSKDYEAVYLCFEKMLDQSKWSYCGVCTAGRGYMGKRLVSCFAELPKQAEYIKSKDDIIYDKSKALYVDTEHIIIDRLRRIPTEFLRKHLYFMPEAINIIERMEGAGDYGVYEKLCGELAVFIKQSEKAQENLKIALENVVEKAKKIIHWNYRLAVPSYFPKGDNMSLLLPMDFLGEGSPQAALVVQLAESGNYIGHTLLSMKHAYLNARLIGSQESSWLTT